jgi:hypothetical protein
MELESLFYSQRRCTEVQHESNDHEPSSILTNRECDIVTQVALREWASRTLEAADGRAQSIALRGRTTRTVGRSGTQVHGHEIDFCGIEEIKSCLNVY